MERATIPKDKGTTAIADYTHFCFCPICGEEYQTWNSDVSFRCYVCKAFITLRKDLACPLEAKKEPSCRWFS